MIDEDGIRRRWEAIGAKLDERAQRMFAAAEVRTAGRGRKTSETLFPEEIMQSAALAMTSPLRLQRLQHEPVSFWRGQRVSNCKWARGRQTMPVGEVPRF